ncbi:hypothetical protein ASG14_08710 [Pedobacter sp. Leaf194]|nr:hypothetical protein ASG14_08710 [Pedobacter sp. Leaf194]
MFNPFFGRVDKSLPLWLQENKKKLTSNNKKLRINYSYLNLKCNSVPQIYSQLNKKSLTQGLFNVG